MAMGNDLLCPISANRVFVIECDGGNVLVCKEETSQAAFTFISKIFGLCDDVETQLCIIQSMSINLKIL